MREPLLWNDLPFRPDQPSPGLGPAWDRRRARDAGSHGSRKQEVRVRGGAATHEVPNPRSGKAFLWWLSSSCAQIGHDDQPSVSTWARASEACWSLMLRWATASSSSVRAVEVGGRPSPPRPSPPQRSECSCCAACACRGRSPLEFLHAVGCLMGYHRAACVNSCASEQSPGSAPVADAAARR